MCVCVLYCLWLLAPSLWPCSSWGGGWGGVCGGGLWLWRASAKALHTSISVFSAEKPMKFEPRLLRFLHQSCDIYVYVFYLEPFWIIFYKNRLCLVFGQLQLTNIWSEVFVHGRRINSSIDLLTSAGSRVTGPGSDWDQFWGVATGGAPTCGRVGEVPATKFLKDLTL